MFWLATLDALDVKRHNDCEILRRNLPTNPPTLLDSRHQSTEFSTFQELYYYEGLTYVCLFFLVCQPPSYLR